jgi:hypothetical protein
MRRSVVLLGVALSACVHRGDDGVDTDTDAVDTQVVDTDPLPADPCLAGGPTLQLGTGLLAFEPIAPGGDVFMTHGPQGGWHVNVSFRAEHVPQVVVLEWRLLLTGTGQVITSEDPFQHGVYLVPPDAGPWACAGDYPGERAYLDLGTLDTDADTDTVSTTWEALCGAEVTLEGDLRRKGALGEIGPIIAQASVTFRLQPDPADGPPCEATSGLVTAR